MFIFLASREIWRNKGRFFLFSMVIALITVLVLFVSALSEGLALANKEYLDKLDVDLLVFEETAELSASASMIGRSLLNDIRRVEGVEEIGAIGFSVGTIIFQDDREAIDVSLIGIEANAPGQPPVVAGENLEVNRGNDVLVDANAVETAGIQLGDEIIVKTIQDGEEEFFVLNVVGLTEGQQYLYAPSIFLPYRTWDKIRPGMMSGGALVELNSNVVAVKLSDPTALEEMIKSLEAQVDNIQAVTPQTAIESIPGFTVQQSTLNTQRAFALLISVLVIGGFFQIQTLQKIPQIGVLKAIGTDNSTVAAAAVLQIILITAFGILLGAAVSVGLSLGIPSSVPIVFSVRSVGLATALLMLMGPAGGLVSVRAAVRVEPLRALGLSS
jgi:putative ABC transport system permease protein